MQDRVSFSQKKSFTPLKFFQNLSLVGKIAFSFFALFFLSLFIGGGYLLLQKGLSAPFELSLEKNYPKEYKKITVEELFSSKEVKEAVEGECIEESYTVELLERTENGWAVEIDGWERYQMKNPCENISEENMKEGIVFNLILRRCAESSSSAYCRQSACAGHRLCPFFLSQHKCHYGVGKPQILRPGVGISRDHASAGHDGQHGNRHCHIHAVYGKGSGCSRKLSGFHKGRSGFFYHFCSPLLLRHIFIYGKRPVA